MLAKTLIAALAVVTVAGTSLATSASASDRGFDVKPVKDGCKTSLVVGAIAGLSGALIASAVKAKGHGFSYASDRGYHVKPTHRRFGHGSRFGHGYGFQGRAKVCFERPVTRWSRYHGEHVTVGYKPVCR